MIAGYLRSRRGAENDHLSVPVNGRPAPNGLEEPGGREDARAFEVSPADAETRYSAPQAAARAPLRRPRAQRQVGPQAQRGFVAWPACPSSPPPRSCRVWRLPSPPTMRPGATLPGLTYAFRRSRPLIPRLCRRAFRDDVAWLAGALLAIIFGKLQVGGQCFGVDLERLRLRLSPRALRETPAAGRRF